MPVPTVAAPQIIRSRVASARNADPAPTPYHFVIHPYVCNHHIADLRQSYLFIDCLSYLKDQSPLPWSRFNHWL